MSDPRPTRAEEGERPERIERTATEARQGEIILGKRGRWIWIGAFALIALLILISAFLR